MVMTEAHLQNALSLTGRGPGPSRKRSEGEGGYLLLAPLTLVLLLTTSAVAQETPPTQAPAEGQAKKELPRTWDVPTRMFKADLAASNMTVLTESPGVGRADYELDLPTLTLRYTIAFDKLTSPATAVVIHGPAQAGTNAPQMLNLAPKGTPRSPLKGSLQVTESQVQFFLQGWTYTLISTQKNPTGEIRGKNARVRFPAKE
jgi:hypothetical protein